MALAKVGGEKEARNKPASSRGGRVRSLSSIRSKVQREVYRKELPETLVHEIVEAINEACKSGDLPYRNYNLNVTGSKNEVLCHYMADTIDERIYGAMAQEIARVRDLGYAEALAFIKKTTVPIWKNGLAFLLVNDSKKFYYDPTEKCLFHDHEKKQNLTRAEQALVQGLLQKLPSSSGAALRAAVAQA